MTTYRPPKWMIGCCAIALAASLGALTSLQPLVLAGMLAVLGAAVASLRPDWVTVVAVGLLYSNAGVALAGEFGLPRELGAAPIMLLLIPVIHYVLVRREPILLTQALMWMTAFLAVQIIGAMFATDSSIALSSLATYALEGLALYILVVNALRSTMLLRRCVWALLLVGATLGALSLLQSVTGTYENTFLGFAQVKDDSVEARQQVFLDEPPALRVAGPIGEKNRYAQIMIVLLPLGVLQARHESTRGLRLIAAAATGLTAVGAALTFSRGGFVGLTVTLVLMTLLRYISLRQLAVIVLGFLVIVSAFPRLGDRVLSIAGAFSLVGAEVEAGEGPDGATLGRAGANLAALRVYAEHPVIGVGPGLFPSHYREQAIEVGLRVAESSRAAHNLYPHIAAENGTFGLLFFGAAIFATMRGLIRVREEQKQRNPQLAQFAMGIFFGMVGYLTTGLFLHLSYQRYLWLLLALGGAVISIARVQVAHSEDRIVPST